MKKQVSEINRPQRQVQDLGEHILLFSNYFDDEFCDSCIEDFRLCEEAGITVTRQQHMSDIKVHYRLMILQYLF